MLKFLRAKLNYANVVATLALFLAVAGGSAYAVSKIDGSDIRKRSLTGQQFKSSSIGGRVVKESSLRPVPKAQNALRLGGQPATRYLDSCPQGTIPIADTCVEVQAHAPASYRSAVFDCSLIDNRERVGRRLPTHGELMAALASPEIALAPGGELTGEVYPSSSAGKVDVLFISDENGAVGLAPDDGTGAKSYRCVADPMN
jgi:hypothetical protein